MGTLEWCFSRPNRTYQTYRATPPTFLIWNNYVTWYTSGLLPESDCGYLTATPCMVLVGFGKHP